MWPLGFSGVIVGLSIKGAVTYYESGNNYKEEYREGALYISHIVRNDAIIVLGWKPNGAFYNHYLKRFLDSSGRSYELTAVSTSDDVKAICEASYLRQQQIILFQHERHTYDVEMRRGQNFKPVSLKRFRGLIVDEYLIAPCCSLGVQTYKHYG